jgi:hypothetical protein
MTNPDPGPGLALAGIDESLMIGLGIALARVGAPSPLAIAVPVVCNGFFPFFADPKAWYEVASKWSDIREVTAAAAADITTAQQNLLADGWTDDGATEFRKYVTRLAGILAAFNDLVDTTAQQSGALGGAFMDEQVVFVLAMVSAILECFALSFAPDPTMTTQIIFKSIVIGVGFAMISSIIATIITFVTTISGVQQKINGSYAKLQGLLKDQQGKLDAGAAKLDPERLKVLGDPKSWRLPEIDAKFLN